MSHLISTLLLTFQLLFSPQPDPCGIVEVPYVGADVFQCIPATTCPNTTCDNCKKFGLSLSCTDGCCVDFITFSQDDGTCFTGCGILQIPTMPTWSQDRSGTDCTPAALKLSSNGSDLCNGKTLIVKLCASGGTTLHYSAHYHCPDGSSGYVGGGIIIS